MKKDDLAWFQYLIVKVIPKDLQKSDDFCRKRIFE